MFVFVIFKQKTAYEMRISDWSSDVCSSDLNVNVLHVQSQGDGYFYKKFLTFQVVIVELTGFGVYCVDAGASLAQRRRMEPPPAANECELGRNSWPSSP